MSETTPSATNDLAPATSAGARVGVLSTKDMALYAAMVFIWGTSWIAMTFQIEIVPPLITGIYRFAIASMAMWAWALATKQPLKFGWRIHIRLAALGAFLFSTNFVLFYYAAGYMASGLMAVIFSLASLVNIILSMLFFRVRPPATALIGASLGFAGIALIFWPEIMANSDNEHSHIGLFFGLAGTLSFCIGNMVATANQKLELPLISSTAWGMFYGTILMTIAALVTDTPFLVEWTWTYWAATIWLAIVASVLAFAGYLTLLKNIGAARASYATVLFPIVALALSTIFEGYQWTLMGLGGLLAIIAGNILVMRTKKS